jgi:phospholipid-binding lipoprotein MlaA
MNVKHQNKLVFLTSLFFILFTILVSQAGYANTATTVNATTTTTTEDTPKIKDRFEGFNRVMFFINDKIDAYFLKPLAIVYNTILPRPVNIGIHNFYLNLGNLPTIANDLLQFNFYQGANDFARFGFNSTVGLLGFIDVAQYMDLKPYTNDFGMTLSNWGYENTSYFVLPFFGPTSIRDGAGLFVDYFAFTIYPHIYPRLTRYAIYGLGVIDQRAQLLRFESAMEEAMLDKYVFARSAFMQHRAYQLEINQHLSMQDHLNAKAGLNVSVDDIPQDTPADVID